MLSDELIQKRLEMASFYEENVEEIDKIIFIDEKLYHYKPTNKVVYVKRKKGDGWKEKYIDKTTPKENHKSVNCICWISSKGKGAIYPAENILSFDENLKRIQLTDEKGKKKLAPIKGFDNASFMKIFKEKMIPDIGREIDDFKIMLDNAGIHNMKNKASGTQLVKEYLDTMNIERIDWPARSPDLNPIEHVHKMIQDLVYEKVERTSQKVKNKQDSFKFILEAWDSLDNSKVINLHKKFLDKCKHVIDKNGSNNFSG